jgi:hypothetical protein
LSINTPVKSLSLRERILDRFAASPTGQKLEAEVAAEEAQARRDTQAALLKLEADYERAHQPLTAKCADAQKGWEAAEAVSKAASLALQAAHAELRGLNLTFDTRKARLEADLQFSAPESIAAFVAEMDLRHATIRAVGATVVYSPLNVASGERAWRAGNGQSVSAALASARDARRAALALATDPQCQDVAAAIETLRAGLVAVEEPQRPKGQQVRQ